MKILLAKNLGAKVALLAESPAIAHLSFLSVLSVHLMCNTKIAVCKELPTKCSCVKKNYFSHALTSCYLQFFLPSLTLNALSFFLSLTEMLLRCAF